MGKQDWINTLDQMQQASAAYNALTAKQIEAISASIETLKDALYNLSEGFDLQLSDCRAIDAAFWKMHHAFEHMEPNEYQLEQIEAHNLEWDYDTQTWSEVTPSDETVDDWEPKQ
jgi:hypothetical protein